MVDHTVTAGGWITPPKQATSEIQSIADRVSEKYTQFLDIASYSRIPNGTTHNHHTH